MNTQNLVKPIYKINNLTQQSKIDYTQVAKETSSSLQNKSLTSYQFAEYLFHQHQFIKIQSVLHLYNCGLGYYQPLTTGNGDYFIRNITPIEFRNFISTNYIKETICWLDTLVKESASEEALYMTSHYLNFLDGYLDVMNNIIYPHHPNMIFTSFIPFTYAECYTANDSPAFDQLLSDITNNDDNHQRLLAQVFGYLISEYRKAKHIFVLFGPSNTGKSTWLNLVKAAIGEAFVKSISLHNLTNNFRTVELVGAKANIFAEIDQRKITNIDLIKSLVGGSDKINADVKNGRPIEFINTAALVFSTNTLECLNVADPGNALSNRLLVIPFENVIAPNKIDGVFINKLFQELPCIIKKFAVPGFRYLASNNFHFTLDASLNFKDSSQSIRNAALRFLTETCIFNGTAKVHTEQLYDFYVNFCHLNNYTAMQKLKFKELLINLHLLIKDIPPLTYCEKFRDKGFNRNGFYGITLKD